MLMWGGKNSSGLHFGGEPGMPQPLFSAGIQLAWTVPSNGTYAHKRLGRDAAPETSRGIGQYCQYHGPGLIPSLCKVQPTCGVCHHAMQLAGQLLEA